MLIEFRIHISYKHLVFTKNKIISYNKVYPSVKLNGRVEGVLGVMAGGN